MSLSNVTKAQRVRDAFAEVAASHMREGQHKLAAKVVKGMDEFGNNVEDLARLYDLISEAKSS